MTDSVETLLALGDAEDSTATSWEELEPLWVDAINRRFQECRGAIRVLDQLARKAGIEEVGCLADVVPLLFAHTAYKSYPEAFIEQGRWDRMNLWLGTLSKYPVRGVDVADVQDADDWMERLHQAGHFVFATSGTSGKVSFIDQSAADVAFSNKAIMPRGLRGAERRPIFVLGPRKAPNRTSAAFNHLVETCGRPGSIYFLTEEELRITDLSRLSRTRRRIGQGLATPSEIAAFEDSLKQRAVHGEAMFAAMTDAILRHREEASIIVGLTPQLYSIIQAARERGLQAGCFHPDTYVISGGGAKGFNLPADHVEQIMQFMGLGLDRFTQGYGMQEVSVGAKILEPGRYVFARWLVPLVLDDSGEVLNETRKGQVTGRMALFDISIDGRWGGIVSGDRVVVDYDRSPAGRPGPAVLAITRYSELQGGDDKLTCAGTIDSFVRGAVGA